jgi:TRAP-type C4-dicarboxylate transport system permease large subunit
VVLWGIYTSKFSPTAAAGVTVGFCVLIGLICYPLNKMMGSSSELPVTEKSTLSMVVVEGFTLLQVPSIVSRSAQITGILVPLIAVSVAMQQVMSSLGAKDFIGDFVMGMGGYYAVLFTAMAIVFVTGMILESLPVTIILAPILAPIAASVGIDPIHFAVVFLVGASIGFITPPYGLNLYVASGVTGVPYFRLLRYIVPYLISLITVWFIIALTPALSLMLLP